MKAACGNCAWWRKEQGSPFQEKDKELGICVYNPPQNDSSGFTSWPQTHESEVCRLHKLAAPGTELDYEYPKPKRK